MTSVAVDRDRLSHCYQQLRTSLLAERNSRGHWEGELSTSALSTATAVMALEMVRRAGDVSPLVASSVPAAPHAEIHPQSTRSSPRPGPPCSGGGDANCTGRRVARGATKCRRGVGRHVTQLQQHLDDDALPRRVPRDANSRPLSGRQVAAAAAYIAKAGGVPALRARYGTDKTFSIPILTHCALAGLVDWREVSPLPFELACIPANFYKWARLPVVSYALPALIAIGQVRHHFVKPRNPLVRMVRRLAIEKSLAKLEKIQPASGGFLEAAPLTSFVTMSLAGMGRADHPVAQRGVDFLIRSVRPDGSWPIDTNLATWVTTLSINAAQGTIFRPMPSLPCASGCWGSSIARSTLTRMPTRAAGRGPIFRGAFPMPTILPERCWAADESGANLWCRRLACKAGRRTPASQ